MSNKKTANVGEYKVSYEETPMKIKVEHKSGFFMFRVFAGANGLNYFNSWTTSDLGGKFSQVLDVISVVTNMALTMPDYFGKLRQFHIDYTDALVAAAPVLTKDEDDKILKEVEDEYNEGVANAGPTTDATESEQADAK